MSTIIAPSILAADPSDIASAVALASSSGCSYLHIDIMDGEFVPAKTFAPDFVKKISTFAPEGMTLDVHLMTAKPWMDVPSYVESGADSLTFHLEACPGESEAHATISLIHALGKKAGIAIKPQTPLESLSPYLTEVDLVLIMSVEPGKGGQSFLEGSPKRIAELARKRKELSQSFLIEVDGGINDKTAPLCLSSGADVLVAGSYLYGHDDFSERVRRLMGL